MVRSKGNSSTEKAQSQDELAYKFENTNHPPGRGARKGSLP